MSVEEPEAMPVAPNNRHHDRTDPGSRFKGTFATVQAKAEKDEAYSALVKKLKRGVLDRFSIERATFVNNKPMRFSNAKGERGGCKNAGQTPR
ncbi:hypothetical protein QQS21_004429 [Conoideocrella luteorostrata]|uniref:Uncharacterized protein n=1 Tax=Conoideocrella luteorostrata TaxID=1105319 RepID=A0AAJ0CVI7_9HYPO|nr:hypothetical protein QQS21_004429 [Conoideocrella luteorostrata]